MEDGYFNVYKVSCIYSYWIKVNYIYIVSFIFRFNDEGKIFWVYVVNCIIKIK